MKKHFLLLAGSAILFASCGSNENKQDQSKAQIDSAVNAKVAEHDAEVAKADSAKAAEAAAAAAAKAAEAEAAEKAAKEKGHASHAKTHTTKTETPAPPPPPPTVGSGKPSMRNDNAAANPNVNAKEQKVGNGKPSMK